MAYKRSRAQSDADIPARHVAGFPTGGLRDPARPAVWEFGAPADGVAWGNHPLLKWPTTFKLEAMNDERRAAPCVSLAVRAWNEEKVIHRTLESLFRQSLFEELSRRGERCEIVCIPNGCTDRTSDIARTFLAEQKKAHPFAGVFDCHVAEIAEAGRNHTWNLYVHELSSRDAEFLFLMDADIWFEQRNTLFQIYDALRKHPEAHIAGGRAIKDIALKKHQSLRDRLSLATSAMNGTSPALITGQLYCIRAAIARRLWLPNDLGAPDDGFIKTVVCTDFFRAESNPARVVIAGNAMHMFEAYTAPREILNNQKRQMIGQTTVHVLVEYLKTLPLADRTNPAATLKHNDTENPDWLKQLLREHLRRARFFWRLFPGALTFRFRRWWKLPGRKRFTHFPAALAGFVVTLLALFRAHRHLRRDQTRYWPKAQRGDPQPLPTHPRGSLPAKG